MLMGGSPSKFKKYKYPKSRVVYEIDSIAANYIYTAQFKDLKNLTDSSYCDNLIIMTSEIIANKMHKDDIKYLSNRLTNGVKVKELSTSKTLYIKKTDLENLDTSNSTTKKHMCIGIAKFYIKVGHLFSAILKTVNPVYDYTDLNGEKKRVTLSRKNSIHKDATITMLTRNNFCNIREDALINNQDFEVDNNAPVTINPRFCEINEKKNNLSDDIGMPELEKLYYDIYDFENGGFNSMSDKMKKTYEEDVKTLNDLFT